MTHDNVVVPINVRCEYELSQVRSAFDRNQRKLHDGQGDGTFTYHTKFITTGADCDTFVREFVQPYLATVGGAFIECEGYDARKMRYTLRIRVNTSKK